MIFFRWSHHLTNQLFLSEWVSWYCVLFYFPPHLHSSGIAFPVLPVRVIVHFSVFSHKHIAAVFQKHPGILRHSLQTTSSNSSLSSLFSSPLYWKFFCLPVFTPSTSYLSFFWDTHGKPVGERSLEPNVAFILLIDVQGTATREGTPSLCRFVGESAITLQLEINNRSFLFHLMMEVIWLTSTKITSCGGWNWCVPRDLAHEVWGVSQIFKCLQSWFVVVGHSTRDSWWPWGVWHIFRKRRNTILESKSNFNQSNEKQWYSFQAFYFTKLALIALCNTSSTENGSNLLHKSK